MADHVIERTEQVREAPRDTTVVHDHDTVDRGSNTGLIIGVIILILILLLLFGRGLISGGSGSGGASSGGGSTTTSTGK